MDAMMLQDKDKGPSLVNRPRVFIADHSHNCTFVRSASVPLPNGPVSCLPVSTTWSPSRTALPLPGHRWWLPRRRSTPMLAFDTLETTHARGRLERPTLSAAVGVPSPFVVGSVLGGARTVDATKLPGKVERIAVADLLGDRRDRPAGRVEQFASKTHTQPGLVFERPVTSRAAKERRIVRAAQTDHAGKFRD